MPTNTHAPPSSSSSSSTTTATTTTTLVVTTHNHSSSQPQSFPPHLTTTSTSASAWPYASFEEKEQRSILLVPVLPSDYGVTIEQHDARPALMDWSWGFGSMRKLRGSSWGGRSSSGSSRRGRRKSAQSSSASTVPDEDGDEGGGSSSVSQSSMASSPVEEVRRPQSPVRAAHFTFPPPPLVVQTRSREERVRPGKRGRPRPIERRDSNMQVPLEEIVTPDPVTGERPVILKVTVHEYNRYFGDEAGGDEHDEHEARRWVKERIMVSVNEGGTWGARGGGRFLF